jgi:hypothetical protein
VDDGHDLLDVVRHLAQEVDVHGGTRKRDLPRRQHERPLEDELLGVRRPGQPEEEALHGEVLEQLVERATGSTRLVEEALADGGDDILELSALHSRVSM